MHKAGQMIPNTMVERSFESIQCAESLSFKSNIPWAPHNGRGECTRARELVFKELVQVTQLACTMLPKIKHLRMSVAHEESSSDFLFRIREDYTSFATALALTLGQHSAIQTFTVSIPTSSLRTDKHSMPSTGLVNQVVVHLSAMCLGSKKETIARGLTYFFCRVSLELSRARLRTILAIQNSELPATSRYRDTVRGIINSKVPTALSYLSAATTANALEAKGAWHPYVTWQQTVDRDPDERSSEKTFGKGHAHEGKVFQSVHAKRKAMVWGTEEPIIWSQWVHESAAADCAKMSSMAVAADDQERW